MSTSIQADFAAYQEKVTEALVNVTRRANVIGNHDLSFHRSLSEDVSKSLDSQSVALLRLTNKLLRAVAKDTNLKPPILKDTDDIQDKWRPIVDVIDDQLEKADAHLDEFHGRIKRDSPAQSPGPSSTPEPSPYRPRPTHYSNSHVGMPKPQTLFNRKTDNFQTSQWRPLLTQKPHALVPLDECIGSEESGFKHPYASEIEQYRYPDSVYQSAIPVPFTRPEKVEPIWVDTEDGVQQMLQELMHASEIAIDLEHNNTNSYVGMVCLMQISTRTQDWVVDTLKPWRETLQCLNQVFADPTILKVFHGATSDIIWLQRDLGLYIVGLFDTYHASCALNYPHRSLAFLLKKFASFDAQKQYQLADWRVRPLPRELLDYARSDTHYLLYIYDQMRNELVQSSSPDLNLVDYVLENSKRETLQVYERHPYDRENGLGPDGWLKILLSKSAKSLDKTGFGVFRALHEWRDQQAREMDEGVHSIMSNVYMWNCAELKPETKAQLFNPRALGRTSQFVIDHQQEVIDVIKRGKREGVEGPTVQEVIERNADRIASIKPFKHANLQAKPQEIQQGVAATMQQLALNGDLVVPELDQASEPIVHRTTSSTLLAGIATSNKLHILDPAILQAAMNLVQPIQRIQRIMSHGPSANGDEATGPEIQHSAEAVAVTNGLQQAMGQSQDDGPFTLRERKKKRGADEIDADEDETGAAVGTDVTPADEDELLTSKRQQKAVKKARSQAEKAAREASAADYTPFDYANAQSMLHATDQAVPLPNVTQAKVFNPFAKALDTSTGAKRNRFGKEMAGRSQTFQS